MSEHSDCKYLCRICERFHDVRQIADITPDKLNSEGVSVDLQQLSKCIRQRLSPSIVNKSIPDNMLCNYARFCMDCVRKVNSDYMEVYPNVSLLPPYKRGVFLKSPSQPMWIPEVAQLPSKSFSSISNSCMNDDEGPMEIEMW